MTDFRIAHLAVRKTDIHPARAERRLWIGGVKIIVIRGCGEHRGIAIFGGLVPSSRINSPTVANYQNNRLLRHDSVFDSKIAADAIKMSLEKDVVKNGRCLSS